MSPPAGATAARHRDPRATAARHRDPRADAAPRTRVASARRVSGRARPALAGTGAAAAAPPLRTVRRPARRASTGAPSLAEVVGRLCDSRVLDRLVRGRFWIGVVAFALIGIVAMQLALLKMNTGIGRDLQRESLLQRQNADMEAEVSGLASIERVQTRGAQLGMVATAPGSARFLFRGAPQARRAANALDVALSSATLSATSATSATTVGAAASAAPPIGAAPAVSVATPSSASTGAPGSTTAPGASASAGAPASSIVVAPAHSAAPSAPPPTTPTPTTTTPPAGPGAASTQSSAPASSAPGGGASAPVGG